MTASDFIAELFNRAQALDLGDGIKLTPIQEETRPYRWIRYHPLKRLGDFVHYEISFSGYDLWVHLHDERQKLEVGNILRRKNEEIADCHAGIVMHSQTMGDWCYEVTMRQPVKCGRDCWDGKFEVIQSEIEDLKQQLGLSSEEEKSSAVHK